MLKFKHLFSVICFVLITFAGWQLYSVFFDSTQPELLFSGIASDSCYAGDVHCAVSSNKRGELSVWLDGNPLINKFSLPRAQQEHPFTIPTRTIANGRHTLLIELNDTTIYKQKTKVEQQFFVDNVPLQAAFVRPDAEYKVLQGRTLHVQFQANKEIKDAQLHTLSNRYKCYPESKNSLVYEAFVPVPCEESPSEYLFTIELADKVGNSLNLENKFQVVLCPFKKGALTVDPAYVQTEKEKGMSHQELEQRLAELSQVSPDEKLWRGAFCVPIEIQRVTTEFGTIRTTQERGRYMHKALDVINTPKSVVWSTQDGVVVLKDRYALSGNTVVVDHGCGVLSMFYHLDDFADIAVGQKIAKGNPVGTLGKTGYAKGYHLHWETRVNNIPVDPMQWTKDTF